MSDWTRELNDKRPRSPETIGKPRGHNDVKGHTARMIALFTDFGAAGPYVGQIKAVLHREAPEVPVIDLQHDAPPFRAQASAYLLAALTGAFPDDAVFLCIVDPGVGGDRAPAIVEADRRRFVGPDNGLFEIVMRRASKASFRRIVWRPNNLSASFHGRDLFAPVAARLALGKEVETEERPVDEARRRHWPDDLQEVIYLDAYGNAMTGVRTNRVSPSTVINVAGRELARAKTFSDLPEGAAFWYENSSGLVEFAVNRGDAGAVLGIGLGATFSINAART